MSIYSATIAEKPQLFSLDDRLSKLAKAFSTTYFDYLSAIASKDGVAAAMIQLDDGGLLRFRFNMGV